MWFWLFSSPLVLVFQHRKYAVQCLDSWISGREVAWTLLCFGSTNESWFYLPSALAHDEKRGFKSREAVHTVPLQHVSLSGIFLLYSLDILQSSPQRWLSMSVTAAAHVGSHFPVFSWILLQPSVGQELDPEVTCPFVLPFICCLEWDYGRRKLRADC